MEGNYENLRRVVYGEEQAIFIPVCIKCGRFVVADPFVRIYKSGDISKDPNATCKKCGRTRMPFEGYL